MELHQSGNRTALSEQIVFSLWPGAVRTELFSDELGILSAEHVKKHYKVEYLFLLTSSFLDV